MAKVESNDKQNNQEKNEQETLILTNVESDITNIKNFQRITESGMIYDESHMPVENLEFISEIDGYCYYEDPINKTQYSLDSAGFWYVWDESQQLYALVTNENEIQSYKTIDEPIVESKSVFSFNLSKKNEINGITFDEKTGFPIFPTNDKGKPILPRDQLDQPFFPTDELNNPIFPYDFTKKQWTFPVDDTDEPVFPRNLMNKPLVPVDDNGMPIFPVDNKGTFIFPLDETNCPIPALTPDGRPVVPIDEFGSFVIPRDREGKPLIHIANDNVTPMSLAEYKQWKQYYRSNAKKFYFDEIQQQQHQAATAVASMYASTTSLSIGAMFHPLNLEQNALLKGNNLSMLQRTRRVRPEDIDLPLQPAFTANDTVGGEYLNAQQQNKNNGDNIENNTNTTDNLKFDASEVDVQAQRRKKFLSAQLNFCKKVSNKVGQKKQESGEKIQTQTTETSNQLKNIKDESAKELCEKQQEILDLKANESFVKSNNRTLNSNSKKSNFNSRAEYGCDPPPAISTYFNQADSSNNEESPKESNNKGKKHKRERHRYRKSRSYSRSSRSDSDCSRATFRRSRRDDRYNKIDKDQLSSTEFFNDIKVENLIKNKNDEHDCTSENKISIISDHDSDDTSKLYNEKAKLYKVKEDDDMDIESDENKNFYPVRYVTTVAKDDYGDKEENLYKKRKRNSYEQFEIEEFFDKKRKRDKYKEGRRFKSQDLTNFDIEQLNEYSDLDLVRKLIKHTRRKYDTIKKNIAELEGKRSIEREKLKKLFEIESQVEARLGSEFLPSSEDDD